MQIGDRTNLVWIFQLSPNTFFMVNLIKIKTFWNFRLVLSHYRHRIPHWKQVIMLLDWHLVVYSYSTLRSHWLVAAILAQGDVGSDSDSLAIGGGFRQYTCDHGSDGCCSCGERGTVQFNNSKLDFIKFRRLELNFL